ncbi:MAG: TonB-dependent receptor [Novosphingobium sp.]
MPVSISAFGAEDLEKRVIRSEADLQLATPGVTVRQNLSQNQLNFSIRGQSVDAFSNSSPGVLPYINEVQVSASTATSFFDLQGIQMLKGPQGTLFGRNATGGAVLYQTAKPTNEFEGFFTARVGNYGQHGFQGAINVPIIDDTVLLRVAGDYSKSDGYVHNVYRDTWTGGRDARSVRVSLTIKPFEGLTNELVGQYGYFGGTNADPYLYSVNACGLTNNGYTPASGAACLYSPAFPAFADYVAANPGVFPGGVKALEAYVRTLGNFTAYNDFPARHRAKAGYISNATTLELSDTLTLKNVIGFTQSRANEQNDLDGSPYPIFGARSPANPVGETFRTRQFSNELQLQGKAFDGHLDYIVGGYYSFQRDRQDYPLLAFDLSPSQPGSPVDYGWTTVDRSRALFAQATYRFDNGFSVTGGFRYTWETYSISQAPGTLFFGASDERIKFNKPSWTFGVDYQATPDLLVYAATRGSWRTGGFNGFSPPIMATAENGGNLFLPETVKDVEVGAKYSGRLGGTVPFRLNLAFYNQWVNDIQRTAYANINGNPASFTANVPKAQITGFEADTFIRPASWLELGGSVAFANARFTDPRVSFFGTATDFGPYGDTPRWSGTVFAQVSQDLPGDAGKLSLRGEIYAQTAQYFSNLNNTLNPETRLPGYALGNLRLDWEDMMDSSVTLSAFVKNVGNRGYWVGGVPQGANLGLNIAAWGQPRMYGAEMRFTF